jgi:hypothetical protein
MDEAPRSNRPTPRTPAAIEAELRRRVRLALTQARTAGEGELDDASLAEIIAQAIAVALSWHIESPEHTRGATLSSRNWRPSAGPRGGPPRQFGGPPRQFDERRPFDEPRRGPPYPPRDFDYDERPPRRPRFGDEDVEEDYRPPRFPRRGGPNRPPPRGPRPGGRKPPMGRGGGGGFGPRKPRRGG